MCQAAKAQDQVSPSKSHQVSPADAHGRPIPLPRTPTASIPKSSMTSHRRGRSAVAAAAIAVAAIAPGVPDFGAQPRRLRRPSRAAVRALRVRAGAAAGCHTLGAVRARGAAGPGWSARLSHRRQPRNRRGVCEGQSWSWCRRPSQEAGKYSRVLFVSSCTALVLRSSGNAIVPTPEIRTPKYQAAETSTPA